MKNMKGRSKGSKLSAKLPLKKNSWQIRQTTALMTLRESEQDVKEVKKTLYK